MQTAIFGIIHQALVHGSHKVSEKQALTAAQKYAPGYRFAGRGLDDDHEKTVYELEGINQRGQSVEIDVNAVTGKISHLETE